MAYVVASSSRLLEGYHVHNVADTFDTEKGWASLSVSQVALQAQRPEAQGGSMGVNLEYPPCH
jgi:hypothetical protein